MLSTEQFVRQSLELDLFFLRIMKEHSFFLEAGFTPRDSNFARQADQFKNVFTRLLSDAVSLADGIIRPTVARSGEIVTESTLPAERATEFFTGIKLDTNVTIRELALVRGESSPINFPLLATNVAALNQRAIVATGELIQFKTVLLRNILSCKMFTFNYPLLIEHIRREACLFVRMLIRLQRRIREDIVREAILQEAFWNRIMAEHAKFIRGLLDPTEVGLFNTANNFGNEFDELTRQALELNNQVYRLPEVTEESLRATTEILNFKRQAERGILGCRIRSIIVPLLADHVVREASHFLRLLKEFTGEFGSNP